MSDATDSTSEAGAEGTTETPDTTATPEPKGNEQYDRLLERVDQLSTYTQSQMEALQQALYQQASDDGEEDPYEALDPDDPGYDEQVELLQLQQFIDDRARAIAQEMVQPIHQGRQAEVYDTRASDIESRYTDLMDDKGKPTELAASVMQAAWESAERFGIDSDSDPRFWDVFEMSYKAHKADQIRQAEQPAGRNPAVLESGGASASIAQNAEDEQQRLMERLAQSQRDPFA